MLKVERFREEHASEYPTADYSIIDEVASSQPPIGADSYEQMEWVAATTDRFNDAIAAAHMYTGFGLVYSPLSHTIKDGIERDEFDEPEALARQAIGFLLRWTKPVAGISKYLQGNNSALDQVLHCWQQTYMHPRLKNAAPVTQFGMGMISHIVGDLALSLAESNPPLGYYDDYTTKIGDKIAETTNKLAPELVRGHDMLRKFVIPGVIRYIAHIRHRAWEDFLLVKDMDEVAKEVMRQEFDRRATHRNEAFVWLSVPAVKLVSATEHISTSRLWTPKDRNSHSS